MAVEHEVGEAPSVALEPTSCPPHRFPPAIIGPAGSLCHIFSLSLRELTCAEPGILVTHESIRLGCLNFGAIFAKRLRSRRPQPGDTWHLDEVFIRTQGARTICAS